MNKNSFNFEQFQLAFDHVEKLLDRRQSTTSFYFSVNTAIFAALGLLLKDAQLKQEWLIFSVLLLLYAGIIACWIWRSLLRQYEILLDWWYARLRELENSTPMPAQLVTREYQDLYLEAENWKISKRIGMTERELVLSWIFTSLYVIFSIGIMLSLLP